jgi:hypothetical protein
VQAVCDGICQLPPHSLLRLPTDLAQLVLSRLIETERLDGPALRALAGQHFYAFDLTSYSRPVRGAWLRVLCTPSLESAALSRTPVRPPRPNPALLPVTLLEGMGPCLGVLKLYFCIVPNPLFPTPAVRGLA